MNNKIDVIIPVKERFSLLLNALKTIDLQTLKPEKVWIIDDCSVEKIGDFGNYSFQIEILRNEKNMGPSYSCNLGARKSNADFIAILETDDLWLPEKLYKQHQMAVRYNLDFVYCNYTINNKKNTQKFSNKNDQIFEFLLRRWSCPNPSTFFLKRDSFIKANGFDETMIGTHDHDFWMRISQLDFKFDYVDEFLVKIEDFNHNQMSRDYKTRIKSITHFTKKHKKIIIANKGESYYKTYKKELLSRALIPCLKKTILDLNLVGFILILRYLLFSKIFYKRLIRKLSINYERNK